MRIRGSIPASEALRAARRAQERSDARSGSVWRRVGYYVSNLPGNRLTPKQTLLLVRNHWGIENDTFNSLDIQWLEDSGVWCTQGNSPYVIGVLRLIAYNIVQHLRRRHLRPRHTKARYRPPAWRALFYDIRFVLIVTEELLDLHAAAGI